MELTPPLHPTKVFNFSTCGKTFQHVENFSTVEFLLLFYFLYTYIYIYNIKRSTQ